MSPILERFEDLEVGIQKKFVRQDELIAFEDAANTYHADIAEKYGFGKGHEDKRLILDDAGFMQRVDEEYILLNGTTQGCTVKDKEKAREETREILEKIDNPENINLVVKS